MDNANNPGVDGGRRLVTLWRTSRQWCVMHHLRSRIRRVMAFRRAQDSKDKSTSSKKTHLDTVQQLIKPGPLRPQLRGCDGHSTEGHHESTVHDIFLRCILHRN